VSRHRSRGSPVARAAIDPCAVALIHALILALLSVRINFGIHDCCGPKENVTQAQYVKNLGIIYTAARAALTPGGKILWVSTTPVPVVGTAPQEYTCGRTGTDFNGCVDSYNAAALALLGSKPDVHVLDLNAAVSAVCGKPYST
jgi:hypothetical protein